MAAATQQIRGLDFPSLSCWMLWEKCQGRDLALSTLMFEEYIALLVSNKVRGWVSVQKKPEDKLKGTKSSLEARLSVYRVG